jgi:three-Cys-motif partner protein
MVQKHFTHFRCHVRAIEKRPEWVFRLSPRIQVFTHGDQAWKVVDAKVIPGDFADHVLGLLGKAQNTRALSLWFVDPFGFVDIPYRALEPLTRPMFGPELIINLDLSGIWRKVGPPDQVASVGDVLFAHVDQQKALTALFGSRQRWENALIEGGTYAQNLHSLASAYCDVFTEFQFRSPYRLRSSDGQVRYLIHFTHSDLGQQTFARLFNDSLKRDLFAGRSLDNPARAQAAYSLHQTYRGAVTTVDQIYEERVGNFDRAQLAVVLREAEARGYGSFDEAKKTMAWVLEREESRQLPLLRED